MSDPQEYACAAKIVGSQAWAEQQAAKELPATPNPPSPTTDAYLGLGTAGLFNFSNRYATRDWSVPKYRRLWCFTSVKRLAPSLRRQMEVMEIETHSPVNSLM
jgi:hypothetical protein